MAELHKKIKVSIIGGAGVVGSTAAYRIAQDGTASEIVLVDTRRNLAEAHALDIEQGVVHRSNTRIYDGEVKDTRASDVIILAVSGPQRTSRFSRAEFLHQNLPIVLRVVEELLIQSPSALWIIATVPVDPLVYLIRRTFSFPREKILGVNRNDTSRFLWAISKTLSVSPIDVEAFVLGEHGETQILLFSQIRIHGEKISLNHNQTEIIQVMAKDFLSRWRRLQPGRTAGWTTAESIGDIFRSIATADGRIWICSVSLAGEYGLNDVSLGVPVQFGVEGIKNIIEFDLSPQEKNDLELSAFTIKKQIEEGQILIDQLRSKT